MLRERAITHLHIPPTALAALPVEPLPSLHVLTVGGEPLPQRLVSRWARGRRLFNTYGTTETNWLALTELQDDADADPFPVGRPIGNMEAYIVDTDRQVVPEGDSGELCIGGVGLARGYLNQPELSAEKFVPNPFSKIPGAMVYRTGDRACWLPKGRLALLGRLDQQISIRGFRIEPGEIETLLTQHPFVSEAVVLSHEESSSDHDDRGLI